VDYGVLGTRLTADQKLVQAASEPGSDTAIVDPAGLPFIQRFGPSKARGASGAIYGWLGIKADASFPTAVSEAIKAPGQAKFQQYGEHKVIHVVGPNLHTVGGADDKSVQNATSLLAKSYANTFKEFLASDAARLRLLPISGGIFAGRFNDDIPWMTFAAIDLGFRSLAAEAQAKLVTCFSANKVELCIFGDGALSEFKDAQSRGGAAPEGGPKVLAKLWPGALATISGLEAEKAKQFNGTTCTVLGTEARNTQFLVQLENGAKATLPTKCLVLADGGALVPGARATVTGLQSEKGHQYNGTLGELHSWSKEHSKWLVKLADGKKAPLPAINLRAAEPSKAEETPEGGYPIDLF